MYKSSCLTQEAVILFERNCEPHPPGCRPHQPVQGLNQGQYFYSLSILCVTDLKGLCNKIEVGTKFVPLCNIQILLQAIEEQHLHVVYQPH